MTLPVEYIISTLNLEKLLQELEKETNYMSRIPIVLKAMEDSLSMPIKCEVKNDEESVKMRKEADQLVVRNKGRNKVMLEARDLYSKSIVLAEPFSTALAQAYANRSSVLFNLRKIEECVRDIDRALETNSYPDHLKPNLLRRKAKCLKMRGHKEAERVCEEARCLLENISLSDEKKERLETKMNWAVTVPEEPKLEDTSNRLPSFVPHPNIPSASEAIELKFNEEVGKHMVASRDIATGEILVCEKPYLSLLRISHIYSHCSHCLVRVWDSIPCDHCIFAMYCSQKCKNEAWMLYHDIECPLRGLFVAMKSPDMGPFSLKLTLLALREYGSIGNLREELNKIDNCEDYLMKSFSEDGIYHSDKYRPLHNLLTHESKQHRYEMLILSVNVALTLFNIDRYTKLFGESNKSISALCSNEEALFFGYLLAQNSMRLQLNDHEFSELFTFEFNKLGAVFGAVTSLMNHSCNPNVTRCPVFKDNAAHQVYYALHPISKGSQILDDYGCHFICTLKSEREKFLSTYYFNCYCEACNELWPTAEYLPSIFSIITDKEKKVEMARTLVHSLQWETIIREVSFDDSHENPIVILNDLARSIDKAYQITTKPSKEYYETLELYRFAFIKYYGVKFEL